MPNLCERVIDEDENMLCGEPGVFAITVSNSAGKYEVALCRKHKAEHDSTFSSLRSSAKKR